MTVEEYREKIKLCELGQKLVKEGDKSRFDKANDIFYFTLSINKWREKIRELEEGAQS